MHGYERGRNPGKKLTIPWKKSEIRKMKKNFDMFLLNILLQLTSEFSLGAEKIRNFFYTTNKTPSSLTNLKCFYSKTSITDRIGKRLHSPLLFVA